MMGAGNVGHTNLTYVCQNQQAGRLTLDSIATIVC